MRQAVVNARISVCVRRLEVKLLINKVLVAPN